MTFETLPAWIFDGTTHFFLTPVVLRDVQVSWVASENLDRKGLEYGQPFENQQKHTNGTVCYRILVWSYIDDRIIRWKDLTCKWRLFIGRQIFIPSQPFMAFYSQTYLDMKQETDITYANYCKLLVN